MSDSQNLIVSPDLVKKLLQLPEVDIERSDTLIDIGSGEGIIAKGLLEVIGNEGKLMLVEIDKKYYDLLTQKFSGSSNVSIHNLDFREFKLPSEPFKIFSNIPFNYTSDILNKILDYRGFLQCAYLVMQKEALYRWGGTQVEKNAGETLKSLLTYPFYEILEIYEFKKSDFKPRPSVECVFAKINKREKPLIDLEKFELYSDFAAAISQLKVGEGVWKQVFTKSQMEYMYKNYSLIPQKGINSQRAENIIKVFDSFVNLVSEYKKKHVQGEMGRLVKQESKLEKLYRTR